MTASATAAFLGRQYDNQQRATFFRLGALGLNPNALRALAKERVSQNHDKKYSRQTQTSFASNHCFFRDAMNESPHPVIRKPRFQLPAIGGRIERRILVNFRCDPVALGRIVPAPFRPKLVKGQGMAGICLIRLGGIKPAFLPGAIGLASENAAHRIAVEWNVDGRTHEGVFIPRRDTNSTLNLILGGKLFPGEHHAAIFRTIETESQYKLEMESRDGKTFVRIRALKTDKLTNGSVFGSLEEASRFFRNGALGWSARTGDHRFDGLELTCQEWSMTPLEVEFVSSSFFENHELFPAQSAEFDSAFLMQDIPHIWHARGKLSSIPAQGKQHAIQTKTSFASNHCFF